MVKETSSKCFLIRDLIRECAKKKKQVSRNSPAMSVRAAASQQPPVPPSKLSQRNQTTIPSLPVGTPKNQQTEKR